jgi:hypothetical protein
VIDLLGNPYFEISAEKLKISAEIEINADAFQAVTSLSVSNNFFVLKI